MSTQNYAPPPDIFLVIRKSKLKFLSQLMLGGIKGGVGDRNKSLIQLKENDPHSYLAISTILSKNKTSNKNFSNL